VLKDELLKKVKGVKNYYSFFLFLIEHLQEWKLKNCKGTQVKEH